MKHSIIALLLVLTTQCTNCNAQETATEIQTVPPNRMQPSLNSNLEMVQAALPPETTPVFNPRPIPPNRKQPVISKADIVMAATDKIGILVNNLAQNLAADLKKLLINLPVAPENNNGPKGGLRAMEGQWAIQESSLNRDNEPDEENFP